MVQAAEWDGEFVADLATERALLGEAQMMRVNRSASADQAGASCDKPQMSLVTAPACRSNRTAILDDLRYPGSCPCRRRCFRPDGDLLGIGLKFFLAVAGFSFAWRPGKVRCELREDGAR